MPDKADGLETTTLSAGSIKLSWAVPENDGGADIEQYCIIVNELDEDDALVSDDDALTRAEIVTVDNAEVAGDQTNCSRLGEPANMPISISVSTAIVQVDGDTTMATFTGLAQESRWAVLGLRVERCQR